MEPPPGHRRRQAQRRQGFGPQRGDRGGVRRGARLRGRRRVFTATTIPRLLEAFRHDRVGAVCGNDEPVNLDRTLTRLLAVMTHVGTGLTRRALSLVGMFPIVSGNSGAFRADVVRQVGFGIASALVTTALSMVLDRAWHHLRFLGVLPLWVPYSWMMSLVTVRAIWQEATGATSSWNKLQRTGVRSVQASETAR